MVIYPQTRFTFEDSVPAICVVVLAGRGRGDQTSTHKLICIIYFKTRKKKEGWNTPSYFTEKRPGCPRPTRLPLHPKAVFASVGSTCWDGHAGAEGSQPAEARKEQRRRLCFLLTNTQLWFAHERAHDSWSNRVLPQPQRSVGVEKPTVQQAGKEWGTSLHSPAGLLHEWPTPNVTSQRGWTGFRELSTFPKGPSQETSLKDDCKETQGKQDASPRFTQVLPRDEKRMRHAEIHTQAPVLLLLHCSHNHFLNQQKIHLHRFKIELPQQK